MNNQEIIIQLIIQDLKHAQLLEGLKALGINSDLHYLDISTAIAKLMVLSNGEASDQWAEVYVSFLQQASVLAITRTGENLKQLAEECYLFLKACLEIEKRCREVRT